MPVTRKTSIQITPRAESIAQMEVEIGKIKADPGLNFMLNVMTGYSQLRSIGTTSKVKQLMIAVGLLDNLFESGHGELAPALILLGDVLAQALAQVPEEEKVRKVDTRERKLN